MPYWQFSLTATDANRWMIRMCRQVTGRDRIGVFSWCYHGSVDESFVRLDEQGLAQAREGLVGPAVDPTETTRVAEFNEIDSVRSILEHGDVACLLMEPALTNIGIVLPEPGFLGEVRNLCDEHGTLLIIDETHTLSAGPGGLHGRVGAAPGRRHARQVDRRRRADRRLRRDAPSWRSASPGRRTPTTRTPAAWAARSPATRCRWRPRAPRSARCSPTRRSGAWSRCASASPPGAEAAIADHGMPWSIVSLGARCEFRYCAAAAAHRRRVGRGGGSGAR